MRRLIAGLSFAGLFACASPPPTVYYPPATSPVSSPQAAQGPFQPDFYLYACTPSFANRPNTDRSGRILTYHPLIVANGVILAAAPVNNACMTSGFGPRFGTMHKGIDLQSKPAGTIYSAAPGRILEVSQQTGFGNQVLIGHGNGVYTRYAHLSRFQTGLAPGQTIGFGQPLGKMGETGNATAIHLHYEVLTGDYNTPQKSWGLQARNPLDFPRWTGLDDLS
ncbi:MAG: M23 family metallopeptidase [Pseudomonadota bacterium]